MTNPATTESATIEPKKRGFFFRLLKKLGVLILILIPFTGAGAYFAYDWFSSNVLATLPPDLSTFKRYRPPTSCRVYASNGEQIDEFYLEKRIWVPLNELPKFVWQAFIAAEDRRFLEHKGVDPLGIARALWVNWRKGGHKQGGSTITQQLVKNLITGKDRSYVRKLREATLAYRLEQELTKVEILELYVNYIALGSGNYGVEAASQDYFGISARVLNPGQAALLAGLVPAPSRYSPRENGELAARRRELVLHSMVELRFVDPSEAVELMADPVLLPREVGAARVLGASYATEVRRELRRVLGSELSVADGLQIYTALDLDTQDVAERAIREALAALEKRQGKMGAVVRLPKERWDGFLARAPGLVPLTGGKPLEPSRGDCFQALIGADVDFGKLRAGSWTFDLDKGDRDAIVRIGEDDQPPRSLRTAMRPGDVIRVCLEEKGHVKLDPRPFGEGAAVVIENRTGRVIALVGGYDVSIEGFVRATQARRQPGSSFKPYVYATALLNGKSQLDTVLDAPISLPGGGGKRWAPKNYDGKFHGALPMRKALSLSLNTVAVRLTLEQGPEAVAHTAALLGVRSPIRKDPTIALGSSEVTPMDQTLAYATIARMGVKVDPVYIERLVDVLDREVGRAGGPVRLGEDIEGVLPGGSGPRVMPAGVAYELADMMREVVKSGTARAAYRPTFDRAGKTGTTNGFVDAWFVGFTPRYTVAVWIGTDGTHTLGDKETGGRSALPAWVKIVESLPNVEGERFPIPDEAALVMTEGGWVGLPRGRLPRFIAPSTEVGDEPLPPYGSELALTATTGAVKTSTRAAPLRVPPIPTATASRSTS